MEMEQMETDTFKLFKTQMKITITFVHGIDSKYKSFRFAFGQIKLFFEKYLINLFVRLWNTKWYNKST